MRTFTRLTTASLLRLAVASPAAAADAIIGTPAPDRPDRGTAAADKIAGRGGDDVMHGLER